MRLSELIRADTERIIREWEEFAKTLSAGVSLPRWLLRVHASAILQSIAHDIETPKCPVKQEAKGEGSPGPLEHVAAAHVNLQIESGFDLVQIMAEYRALRACVLRLWRESDPDGFAKGAEEITSSPKQSIKPWQKQCPSMNNVRLSTATGLLAYWATTCAIP